MFCSVIFFTVFERNLLLFAGNKQKMSFPDQHMYIHISLHKQRLIDINIKSIKKHKLLTINCNREHNRTRSRTHNILRLIATRVSTGVDNMCL